MEQNQKYKKICQGCGKEFFATDPRRQYCPGRRCSNKAIALERERKKMSVPVKIGWSCGGGVQSTAMAVLIESGQLRKPDFAWFVDTGFEMAETLEYLYTVTIPRLRKVGVELHVIQTSDYVKDISLISPQGYVVIPAFQHGQEKNIKFQTRCNGQWKVNVARRWLREQGAQRIENWIGISTDEAKRGRESPLKWIDYKYPLIEQGMSREDCIFLIASKGWPKPPRTSCFFCPLQDAASWKRKRDYFPLDWEKAVAVEQKIQETHPNVFLHSSCRPLPEVFS